MLEALNNIGINGFVFISAYYMSQRGSRSNLKKIIAFVIELHFLSILILIIGAALGGDISLSVIVKSVFPVLTQHYWYPFSYLLLLLFSPYINIMLSSFTKRQIGHFLWLLLFISCFFMKVNVFYSSAVYLGHHSHGIIWFFILYVSAFYYRHYGLPFCNWKMLLGSVLLMFMLTMVEHYLSRLKNLEVMDYNALLSWAATCSGFAVFDALRARWLQQDVVVKSIKTISRATFAVYIFQEHDAVRSMLWGRVNVLQYVNAPVYKLALLTVCVFGVLLLISLGIMWIYSLAHKLYIKRIGDAAQQRILSFMNRK